MVQYGELVRELSAMKKTLKRSMGYARESKLPRSHQNQGAFFPTNTTAPSVESFPRSISSTSIAFCGFDQQGSLFDDAIQPINHFQSSFTGSQISSGQPQAETDPLKATNCNYNQSVVLHRACQLFPKSKDVVEIALLSDPGAASWKIQIDAANMNGSSLNRATRQEPYSYAINIAIHHKSNADVVRLLANAAPEVLGLPDGRDGQTTLGILLMQRNGFSNVDLVETLLQANPACAHLAVDRRQNTALHIACSKGASLGVIHCLYQAYPEAILNRNDAGETPLMIAQRFGSCPEEVLDFLQRQTWNRSF